VQRICSFYLVHGLTRLFLRRARCWLCLLKHQFAGSAFIRSQLQLHCRRGLRLRHGTPQRAERLRDCGPADPRAEDNEILQFRTSNEHQPILLAGFKSGCGNLQIVDRPQRVDDTLACAAELFLPGGTNSRCNASAAKPSSYRFEVPLSEVVAFGTYTSACGN
jgi:hypothetical protein